MLQKATQLLALEYKDQVNVFPNFVLITDELVLNYDDAYILLPQIIKRNIIISKKQSNIFHDISTSLKEIDEDKSLFTNDALEKRKEWNKIRQLARKALKAMAWSLEIPKIEGDYIK